MRWMIGLVLMTPSVAVAGPFPFPTKKVDGVAEVRVTLPRRGAARVALRRWLVKPARSARAKLTACFKHRKQLRRHKETMWRVYWGGRKTSIPGDRDVARRKARGEWQIKGKVLRQLIDGALRKGSHHAVVYYHLGKRGVLQPLCHSSNAIYLRHWVDAPGHARWLARELKMIRSGTRFKLVR